MTSSDEMEHATGKARKRRMFLSAVGATTSVAMLGSLAGCTALVEKPVTIGFSPSFRTVQAPVMVEDGLLDELDASVAVKNRDEMNSSLIQDVKSGNIEVVLSDLKWAIKNSRAAVSLSVVAANNVNDLVLLASEEFAARWKNEGADAFVTHREQHGEPFVVGGADSSLLNLWLNALGAPRESVEWTNVPSTRSARILYRKGDIDGVFLPPTAATKLNQSDVGIRPVAWAGNAIPHQPGGVTVLRDKFVENRTSVAEAILEKHVRATEVLTEEPGRAGSMVADVLGGKVSVGLARDALDGRAANFLTDPRPIREETDALVDLMSTDGFELDLTAEELINPSLYESVS